MIRLSCNRLAAGLLIAILIAMPVLTVVADFNDPFDEYPNSVISGSLVDPWHSYNPWYDTIVGATNCWTGTGTLSSSGSLTQPNEYKISYDEATSGCNTASLSYTFSATLRAFISVVNLTYYLKVTSTAIAGSTVYLDVTLCGTTYATLDLSTVVGSGWLHERTGGYVSSVNPGDTCYLNIKVRTAGTPTNAVQVYIDNVYVSGANPVYSDANVFIVQYPGGQWFNITNYPHSTLTINYTGGSNPYGTLIYDNLTTPDVYVPLTNGNLITLTLDSKCISATSCTIPYTRSILITGYPATLYMPDPTVTPVTQYVFQVSDFTDQFPIGSPIFIYQGSTLISAGFLDANHQFTGAFAPGTYQFKLCQLVNYQPGGSCSSTGSVFTESVNLALGSSPFPYTITVPSVKVTGTAGPSGITCLAFWDSTNTHIIAYYHDETGTTTSVTMYLYLRSNNGSYIEDSPTFTGTNITYTTSFSNVNINYTGDYFISCTPTNQWGSSTVYPSVYGSMVLGGTKPEPGIPDVLGFGALFPGLTHPMTTFGGLAMVVSVGAAFGAAVSPIGAVILAFTIAFLILEGFLAIPPMFSAFIIFFTFLGLILYHERQNR